MKNLGITHFYQGQSDKVVAFSDLLQKLNLNADEVAYVGDDVIDLPVMTKVGFAIAVANAHVLFLTLDIVALHRQYYHCLLT
jgi:3-deoxy-D-manno-octulosonate 8-phosphate phosphatase (KDO 8-P phosphatase)